MLKKFFSSKYFMMFCVGLIVCAAVFVTFYDESEAATIAYVDFISLMEAGEIESALFSGKELEITLKNGSLFSTTNPETADLKERMLLNGISITAKSSSENKDGFVMGAVITFVFGGAFYLKMNKQTEVSFDATKVCGVATSVGVNFASVAGHDEAIEGLMDIVSFIKKPEMFAEIGARMPKGVLLYGPPGTGKTLLAQALAGEAGVPFISASGSDFVQMYVGVGAKRVRELFKKARENK